jgi:hypothetical protein
MNTHYLSFSIVLLLRIGQTVGTLAACGLVAAGVEMDAPVIGFAVLLGMAVFLLMLVGVGEIPVRAIQRRVDADA